MSDSIVEQQCKFQSEILAQMTTYCKHISSRKNDDAMLIVPEAAVLSREAARLLPDTAAII